MDTTKLEVTRTSDRLTASSEIMPDISTGLNGISAPIHVPRISFIVPTLNEEKRIGECLKSILAADHLAEKHDIIVIDSGSKDNTVAIARAFHGVTVVELHPEHSSAAFGLNEGLIRATGEYVQYVAADCELNPEWPKKALSVFTNDVAGTLAVVGGQTIEATPYPSIFSYLLGVGLQAGGTVEGFVLHNAGTGLIRRDILKRTGRFNPKLISEDEIDFGIRISSNGFTYLKIPAPMVTHHLDLPNTFSGLKAMLRRLWRLGIGWGQLRDLYPSNSHRIAYMRSNLRFILLPVLLLVGLGLLITSFNNQTSLTLLLVCFVAGLILNWLTVRRYRTPYLGSLALALWYFFSSPWIIGGYLWYLITKPTHLRPHT